VTPLSRWPAETIPVLRVSDAAVSVAWYRRLGFVEEWVHRYEPSFPAFVSIALDEGAGTRLFLSEHRGDAPGPAVVWLRVPEIAPFAAEFGVEPHPVGGRLEIGLVDPDGNRVTVGALGDLAQHPDSEYGYTLEQSD
jgi:catechol 2,3-dioxygenase-like lactoylglutathione lyase family enzyme